MDTNFLDADSFDKLMTSDTDLHCLFEIKLELGFEGLFYFMTFCFGRLSMVLSDWGFLHRDISI